MQTSSNSNMKSNIRRIKISLDKIRLEKIDIYERVTLDVLLDSRATGLFMGL